MPGFTCNAVAIPLVCCSRTIRHAHTNFDSLCEDSTLTVLASIASIIVGYNKLSYNRAYLSSRYWSAVDCCMYTMP
jgi:hypothetical protein